MDPTFLIMIVIVIAMFWFMSRSTRKRQKEAASFRESLTPGVQVMTASGYVGTVVAIEGDLVTLESEEGSRTKWVAAALAKQYEMTPPAPVVSDDAASASTVSGTTNGFVVPDDVSSLITKPGENSAADNFKSNGTGVDSAEKPNDDK